MVNLVNWWCDKLFFGKLNFQRSELESPALPHWASGVSGGDTRLLSGSNRGFSIGGWGKEGRKEGGKLGPFLLPFLWAPAYARFASIMSLILHCICDLQYVSSNQTLRLSEMAPSYTIFSFQPQIWCLAHYKCLKSDYWMMGRCGKDFNKQKCVISSEVNCQLFPSGFRVPVLPSAVANIAPVSLSTSSH